MRPLWLAALGLMIAVTPAPAAQTSGAMALALAALVAEHAPALPARDRYVVAALFAGNERIYYPAGRSIVVRASKVQCRISDVQITARSCQLTAGGRTKTLTGEPANALYATLAAAGVPSDGAEGSIYEQVQGLACTLTPSVIVQNGGGGASCAYAAP